MTTAVDLDLNTDDDDAMRAAGFIVDREDGGLWGSAYAVFDATRRYRYALGRSWGPGAWRAYLMLNPSTADAFIVDPTVQRCLARAQRDGFGGALVVNLFALRSTNPAGLLDVEDPVGPDNDVFIAGMGEHIWHEVIVGWGTGKTPTAKRLISERARTVVSILDDSGFRLAALRVNADGAPKHPLYCRNDDIAAAWSPS